MFLDTINRDIKNQILQKYITIKNKTTRTNYNI